MQKADTHRYLGVNGDGGSRTPPASSARSEECRGAVSDGNESGNVLAEHGPYRSPCTVPNELHCRLRGALLT